jgi:hypothetical protein
MKGKVKRTKWQEEQDRLKRVKKIATLKKYAKLCRAEGIASDRVNLSNYQRSTDEHSSSMEEHKYNSKRPKLKVKSVRKNQQTGPTPKEMQQQLLEQQLQEKEEIRLAKEKQRKEQHKIMTLKTKKGQPVMAGRIKNILNKLMDENDKK